MLKLSTFALTLWALAGVASTAIAAEDVSKGTSLKADPTSTKGPDNTKRNDNGQTSPAAAETSEDKKRIKDDSIKFGRTVK